MGNGCWPLLSAFDELPATGARGDGTRPGGARAQMARAQ
jgi:hypothetical protein